MTQPLVMFCQAWPECSQAAACFGRIQDYLQKDQVLTASTSTSSFELPSEFVALGNLESQVRRKDPLITFQHAAISWSLDSEPVLRDLSITVYPGFTAVIGQVAAGKSTILSGMLGETIVKRGSIIPSRLSSVAFCPQSPWIMDDTIRRNITGDLDFDQKRYEFCLYSCGLQDDLRRIPQGDMMKAGSSGASLSGGQRQRVVCTSLPFARLSAQFCRGPCNNVRGFLGSCPRRLL